VYSGVQTAYCLYGRVEMGALCSSETFVVSYQTTGFRNIEGHDINLFRRGNILSYKLIYMSVNSSLITIIIL
jgi:hypothetical protein